MESLLFKKMNSQELVEQLKSVGMYEEIKPSECMSEVLRVLENSNDYRDFSDMTGYPKRVPYERMKAFYEDYGCLTGYRYFMQVFPVLDELWISEIIKGAKK